MSHLIYLTMLKAIQTLTYLRSGYAGKTRSILALVFPFQQNMRCGSCDLLKAHSAIKICRTIGNVSTQTHENAPQNRLFDNVSQDVGSNAACLKVRIDCELVKVDSIVPIFDRRVTTAQPII